MNFVIRNFFYAVGLTMLLGLYNLDPATAHFGDLVQMVRSAMLQRLVGIITLILCGLDMLMSGWFGGTTSVTRIAASTARSGGAIDGQKFDDQYEKREFCG